MEPVAGQGERLHWAQHPAHSRKTVKREDRVCWCLGAKPRGLSPRDLVNGGSQRVSGFTLEFGTAVQ